MIANIKLINIFRPVLCHYNEYCAYISRVVCLVVLQSHIKTNEKARVVFQFKFKPEYLRVGARLLFRDGKTKGVGEVTQIFPLDTDVER